MASNLRVDQITSSTTGSVSIGTATFTGGLSGDITGLNVTGVITATTLNQNLGAGSSITIGDTFIKQGAIGIGTIDTAGRNAGVGTAVGTLSFVTDRGGGTLQVYTGTQWQDVGANEAFEATGGTVDSVTRSGYKIHTFTTPGSFEVTSGSKTVEYLVVAGGGGGGSGGGGGAGGMRTGTLSVTTGTYPVIRGGGGNGGNPNTSGSPSTFSTIISQGGGKGGLENGNNGNNGGSGGGGGRDGSTGGTGNRETDTTTPAPTQGNDGGNSGPGVSWNGGGGGGGAGGGGNPGGGPTATNQEFGGNGGPGSSSSITGITVTYAGGGGGAAAGDSPPGLLQGQPGPGGGGIGGVGFPGVPGGILRNGTAGTDGLGGGGGAQYSPIYGYSGGSGVVIIAYPTS